MVNKVELSIVAVFIDNKEVTERFVSSIRQYTKEKYELILIDNGSRDKKAMQYGKRVADVYHRFDKIVDLAKAWNKGIALSKGKYIAVVNNDTVVRPNWFPPLRETLQKNKKIGMVSPITYWLIKGYYKYKNLRNFDTTFSKPFNCIKFKDVVWGEFCVFKAKALEAVEGYCELYKKATGEDLEICFQLYDKGYEIWVDPRVFIYHQGEASRKFRKNFSKLNEKNFQLFKSRWPKYTKGWK